MGKKKLKQIEFPPFGRKIGMIQQKSGTSYKATRSIMINYVHFIFREQQRDFTNYTVFFFSKGVTYITTRNFGHQNCQVKDDFVFQAVFGGFSSHYVFLG